MTARAIWQRLLHTFWETENGVGWTITNLFSLLRTIIGIYVETHILHISFLFQNGPARVVNTLWDQGSDWYVQPWRRRLKKHFSIEGRLAEYLFDTLYMMAVKLPVYFGCFAAAGVAWQELRWIVAMNLIMSLILSRPNCYFIDLKLQRDEEKRRQE